MLLLASAITLAVFTSIGFSNPNQDWVQALKDGRGTSAPLAAKPASEASPAYASPAGADRLPPEALPTAEERSMAARVPERIPTSTYQQVREPTPSPVPCSSSPSIESPTWDVVSGQSERGECLGESWEGRGEQVRGVGLDDYCSTTSRW
jgi:hypothetical protein